MQRRVRSVLFWQQHAGFIIKADSLAPLVRTAVANGGAWLLQDSVNEALHDYYIHAVVNLPQLLSRLHVAD